MLTNVTARSAQLMRGLTLLAKRHPITDIRGRGLMVGVEFGGTDGGRKAEKGVAGVSVILYALCAVLMLAPAGAHPPVAHFTFSPLTLKSLPPSTHTPPGGATCGVQGLMLMLPLT